jgi:hypothetical protein
MQSRPRPLERTPGGRAVAHGRTSDQLAGPEFAVRNHRNGQSSTKRTAQLRPASPSAPRNATGEKQSKNAQRGGARSGEGGDIIFQRPKEGNEIELIKEGKRRRVACRAGGRVAGAGE